MTIGNLYFENWDEMPAHEISRALRKTLPLYGSRASLAKAIDWDLPEVRRYLRLRPRDFSGQPFFVVTAEDLHRMSRKQVDVMTKRAIVERLREELQSMRAVARFLGKNDKYLGQLMAEANL